MLHSGKILFVCVSLLATSVRADILDVGAFFETNSLTNRYDGKLTFNSYLNYALRAHQAVRGLDIDVHRYDNKLDLINSFTRNLTYSDDLGGLVARIAPNEAALLDDQSELTLIENEQNQVNCGQNLVAIIKKLEQIIEDPGKFHESKQLGLIDFIDSFGAFDSQLMIGSTVQLGSSNQCQSARIVGLTPKPIGGRYCVANLRATNWQSEIKEASHRLGGESLKMGICLPDSCNTISILRHEHLIHKLVQISRTNKSPFRDYQMSNLFCLPDEASPLRQLSWSARIFILLLVAWFTCLLSFSMVYEINRANFVNEFNQEPQLYDAQASKLMKVFSLRICCQSLFNERVTKAKKQTAGEGPEMIKFENKLAVVMLNSQKAPTKKSRRVDLSVIDGIKVLSMMWLVCGHTLLFLIRTIANGRDFWDMLKDARFLSAMAGIFPVDGFFTITGILTAYLRFYKKDPINKCNYWFETFIHRYLRFMPMYLIMFLYSRELSEYVGSGPLWDYGTSDTSSRSLCKKESISVPLLFLANFKSLDQHCVKPAWYIANDYQYLLLTPIFLAVIAKSTFIGYSFIISIISSSLIIQFMTIFYSSDIDDFETLANFKPMFASYVLKSLWKVYVLPYNRISPYLIGLITGHMIYKWTQDDSSDSRSLDNEAPSCKSTQGSLLGLITFNRARRADLNPEDSQFKVINNYICTKVWLPILLLVVLVYSPLIAAMNPIHGLAAKIASSTIMGLARILWSLATARLIYVCATRHAESDPKTKVDSFVIGLLSAKIWRPWSKIGLTALMVQWEVVIYVVQSQVTQPYLTFTYLLSTILLCIVTTYSISTALYLTIEYPLSQVAQLYITPTLFKKRAKKS